MKILMASAEIFPFAKAGGLADVLGSLPKALEKENIDIRLIMPKYGSIDEKRFKLKLLEKDIQIRTKGHKTKISIWQSFLPKTKIPVYFIENKKYFSRPKIYWGNNSERFLFFSWAIFQALPIIDFKPDVIHAHDYHTAMIADILKVTDNTFFYKTKCLFTIHNLNYQGKSEIEVLSTANLNEQSLKVLSDDARDGDINFMAQGILSANAISTVSKKYAKEITTSFYGKSMEKLLRKRKKDLYGITNGIDTDLFDPSKDKLIKFKYNKNTLNKKTKNKLYLQKKLGLKVDENIPLFGFVARLVWQKGLDLLSDDFFKLNAQFVFLGTGKKEYEKLLLKFSKKYPKKVKALITFDLKTAQEIYAGSDMFLMLSRFEPCGLGQMIAMRYGTLPIARATGGLDDTIDNSSGFKFKNFDSQEFLKTCEKAIKIFANKQKWQKMQKHAMSKDFSWKKSAKEYVKIYKKIL